MSALERIVLDAMGNRALAERAARRYADSSGGNVEVEAPSVRRRRVLMFPFALMLATFHLLALSFNLLYLLLVYLRAPERAPFRIYCENWDKLAEHWGRYPACFVYKAVEAALYHDLAPNDASKAVEIGVYTGETSRGMFKGKNFLAGVEYNIERFLAYARGERLHKYLYAADVRRLPFAEAAFSDVYCVHSVDDMELPAEEALQEMARVTRDGGGVYFSGLTFNFSRHNLLVRMLNSLRFERAARSVFSVVYIGSFNLNNRQTWGEILDRCNLELVEYRTYIPFRLAGWFDLAYRPETVLINLCGWRRWLEPVTSTRIFRAVLYRAIAAMLRLSREDKSDEEGINFFIAARRKSSIGQSEWRPFTPTGLRCVRCTNPMGDPSIDGQFVCRKCDLHYPVVEGIPVMLDLGDAPRDILA